MKKSIIAIAFLLLCPFYGVRAQERPFFDLSGKGWHLWQDKNAAWQTEDIYLTLEEARKSPVIVPTAGWDILTSAQTLSVQVPGTAEEYLQTQSGPEGDITGVTWWSRTMDIPVLKKGQKVFLNFGSIRSRAEIFIKFNNNCWPTTLALFSLLVLKVFIDSFMPSRSTGTV